MEFESKDRIQNILSSHQLSFNFYSLSFNFYSLSFNFYSLSFNFYSRSTNNQVHVTIELLSKQESAFWIPMNTDP